MDVTSALAVIIPDNSQEDIVSVRKLHDRAYPRWPNHINFFFPFSGEDKFDDITARLEPVLKSFGQFEVEMSELGFFKQGKNITAHLKPSDASKFKELFEVIRKTLPEVETKHDEFNPHMTLGQFKKNETDAKMKELEEWLANKNFKFVLDHICILQRSKTDNNEPFHVNRKIMLC